MGAARDCVFYMEVFMGTYSSPMKPFVFLESRVLPACGENPPICTQVSTDVCSSTSGRHLRTDPISQAFACNHAHPPLTCHRIRKQAYIGGPVRGSNIEMVALSLVLGLQAPRRPSNVSLGWEGPPGTIPAWM